MGHRPHAPRTIYHYFAGKAKAARVPTIVAGPRRPPPGNRLAGNAAAKPSAPAARAGITSRAPPSNGANEGGRPVP